MNIKLIDGQFAAHESLDILTRMLDVKIKYHEQKIAGDCSEEDIKMREKRIKELQNDLHHIRQYVHKNNSPVNLLAELTISN